MKSFKTLINGKLIDTKTKLGIKSPMDNEVIAEVPALSKSDIDSTFEAANKAFKSWSNLLPKDRIAYVNKFKAELKKKRKEIAMAMCLEIAKPLKACYSEFDRTIEYIDLTIDAYKKEFVKPTIVTEKEHGMKGKKGNFYRVPLGVVLAISPYNYPLNLALSKIAPALLTGNTCVYKPATNGSIVGVHIAEAFYNAKLPAGVINVVTGKGSEIGDYIVENKHIAMISFTGGVEVGKRIASLKPMIPLVLELGGKDAAIVLKDCDIKKTAKEIVKGSLDFSGQRCTAIKLVYADDKIADKLIKEIVELTKNLKIGSPLEEIDLSAMINGSAVKWAQSLVDDALNKKAKLVFGNKVDGNIFFPTIIDNVKPNMKIFDEEQFAPIIPIVRYKTDELDKVIDWVNESKFGLQGSIFSTNDAKAKEIAMQINTGTVNINKSSSRGPDIFPFLGVKDSGFGVQGIKWALESMTRIKGIIENN